jgi:integrase
MTWAQWDGEWITLIQQKTGTELFIPLDKEMQAELARWKREATTTTILATYRGRPWTPAALSIAFDREVKRLKLTGLSIHGCRHLAATRLALAGASAFEVAAITGHKSLANVQRYTRKADQKRRASNALGKLVSFVGAKEKNGAK